MKFISSTQEDVLIIRFQENLIEVNLDLKLTEVVDDHLAQDVVLCALDLSEVGYVNSSGLGNLMKLLARFRYRGGELVLFNLSENIQNLLIITKLIAIFTIGQNEEEALKLLRGQLKK